MLLDLGYPTLATMLKESPKFREEFVRQMGNLAISEARYKADFPAVQKQNDELTRRVRQLECAENDASYYKKHYERELENRRHLEAQATGHQSTLREVDRLRYEVALLKAEKNGGNVDELTRHEGEPYFTLNKVERNACIEIMRRAGAFNKIACIKEVRQHISNVRGSVTDGMGLANAKYFVENKENRTLAGYETGEVPF